MAKSRENLVRFLLVLRNLARIVSFEKAKRAHFCMSCFKITSRKWPKSVCQLVAGTSCQFIVIKGNVEYETYVYVICY